MADYRVGETISDVVGEEMKRTADQLARHYAKRLARQLTIWLEEMPLKKRRATIAAFERMARHARARLRRNY